MLTGHETIVVIEDDPGVRKVMKGLFPLLKINGHFAENGLSGIELIKEIHPDIIICDIMLPDMEGYDVLTSIKSDKNTYKIPFIFLSAFADPMDIRKGMDLGADDYLTKPFTSATLLKTIESRIEIKRKNDTIDSIYENEKWLSLFTGNFNHEFMTPLNGIINSVELIKRNESKVNPDFLSELTNAIYASGYRMMRNTKKLLMHTLMTKTPKSSIHLHTISNVNAILLDSISQIKKQYYDKEVKFVINISEPSKSVLGSYEYIKFVFDELLDNGYKFSTLGSPIKVNLTNNMSSSLVFEIVNHTSFKEGDFSADKVKPFKQFHTATDGNGLGLGLSSCIAICELLNYIMEIEYCSGCVHVKVAIPYH